MAQATARLRELGTQAAAEAAIELEIAMHRQVRTLARVAERLATLRVAPAARAQAARGALLVWEAPVAVAPAAAVGGGNQ
jgi:hypothetical protein